MLPVIVWRWKTKPSLWGEGFFLVLVESLFWYWPISFLVLAKFFFGNGQKFLVLTKVFLVLANPGTIWYWAFLTQCGTGQIRFTPLQLLPYCVPWAAQASTHSWEPAGPQKGTLGVGGVDSLGVPNPHRQLDKHCSLGGTFTSWQIIRTTSFIFIFHFARKYFGIRQNNFCTAERYLEWQKKNTSSGCVDGDPSTNMTAHHPELQLGNENFYRFSPFVAARVLIACQTIYRERNNPRPLLDQPHLNQCVKSLVSEICLIRTWYLSGLSLPQEQSGQISTCVVKLVLRVSHLGVFGPYGELVALRLW